VKSFFELDASEAGCGWEGETILHSQQELNVSPARHFHRLIIVDPLTPPTMKFLTTLLRFSMLAAAALFLLLLTWCPCPTDGAVPAGTGNRIDFEDIPAGNVVVAIGPDITINALYEPFDVNPHPLLNSLPVCFDSSKPGLGEKQVALGSPYVLMHYAGLFANLCCR
jgi:hypothetical protein